jgi:prephenate dehydrogenase
MTDSPKTNVCIVGVGLIGGSLGLALKKNRPQKYSVMGLGRDEKKLRAARKMNAIDSFTTEAAQALPSADIVVLCVPVHRLIPQLEKISRWLKHGAVVTDVGSVKKNFVDNARRALKGRTDVHVVGAHPIAGSEKTGVANATATLFNHATCVLTSSQSHAFNLVKTLWTDAGARCVEMTAAEHDRYLALTSHLPHLLAFSLFQSVSDAAKKNPIVGQLVAGSFRDMTRIAGADPDLWAGVLENNRREIQTTIRDVSARLDRLGRAPLSQLLPTLRRLQRAKEKWPTRR